MTVANSNVVNIDMQQMLSSGVHFGHQTRYWHPKMASYIFGIRHKIHIINLDKSLPLFQEALNFVGKLAAKRGKILFVGTKPSAQDIIRSEAERCGMPYASYRWLGGMLTNYKTIRQSIKRLKEQEDLRSGPNADKLTKKELLMLDREIVKLDKSLGGIRKMGGLPDAMFVIDIGHESIAVSEAKKLRIPIIGVVDTNCNPDGISYVIPGNDDAIKAIRFYAQNIADAIIAGRGAVVEEEKAIEEKEVKEGSRRRGGANRGRSKVVVKATEEVAEKRSGETKSIVVSPVVSDDSDPVGLKPNTANVLSGNREGKGDGAGSNKLQSEQRSVKVKQLAHSRTTKK